MITIKIGGTSGSGKSTAVRALLERYKPEFFDEGGKYRYYSGAEVILSKDLPPLNLVVLGSYHNACGGMDGVSDTDMRLDMVRRFCVKGNLVVMEGLIIGGSYGKLGELSEELGQKEKWLYVFPDTPVEVCAQRVLERRAAKGNDAPFDPERTLAPKHKQVERLKKGLKERGLEVWAWNHTYKPSKIARKLLERAGKLYESTAA